MNQEELWNLLYRRWRTEHANLQPGYTLLLTVPPDLPVFLKIAVSMCARQDPAHRVESIVVPDHVHPPFRERFAEVRDVWPEGNLRLVEYGLRDRLLRRYVDLRHFKGFAATIHWLQLNRGIEAARSRHVLLHDADLFLIDRNFLRRYYEHGVEEGCAFQGLDRPWSGFDWFDQPGFEHVLASWEMMFDLEQIRAKPPWMLRPQGAHVHGRDGWFGTSLYAQADAGPPAVARYREPFQHVHFGYVVSGYRQFQRSRDSFVDENYSLVLIRLLVDAFDPGRPYDLPSMDELARGLTDASNPVVYDRDGTESKFPAFRTTLEELLASDALDAPQVEAMRRAIAPFDEAHGWSPAQAPATS